MRLLIKNELIKIRKQTAFRVMTIIFAILIVLVPICSMLIDKAEKVFADDEGVTSWYREYAEECLGRGDYIGYVYYGAYSDADDYFTSIGLTADSFERNIYYNSLATAFSEKGAVELLLSGKIADINTMAEARLGLEDRIVSLFSDVFPDIFSTLEVGPAVNNYKLIAPYLTKDRLQQLLVKAASELLEIQNEIRNFDIKTYYGEDIEKEKTKTESYKSNIESMKESLEIAPDGDKSTLSYNIEVNEKAVEVEADIIKAKQHLYDNVCEYNGWEYKVVNCLIIPALNSIPDMVDMPEDVYASNPRLKSALSDDVMSYSEYLKDNHSQLKAVQTAIAMGFDSLETGTPLKNSLSYSPKSSWQSQLTTVGSICAIIIIVLAGTTMSSEYSSGSIRLLLIRPKKRSKILCSKIIAMTIYWAMLMITAYILLFALNLIGGVGDMFVPDIKCIFGKIVHLNSFLSTLIIMLEDMISSAVYVSLALLMSLLIRKTALAIALPIIARDAASTIQYACIVLRTIFGNWVTWLPFSYSELSYLRVDPTTDYLPGTSSLSQIINSILNYTLVGEFKMWYGILCAAVVTCVYTILCFTAFKKQQIKN